MPSTPRRAGGLESVDAIHPLWVAWEEAWLREYRCYARYLSLLALDGTEDVELASAWLEWWNATCDCRDASRRLDDL